MKKEYDSYSEVDSPDGRIGFVKKQRVTHVGIWLGNGKGEFIHSASNVHLSSINENEKHYDKFNTNRYLGSRRYLGVKDDQIIDLKESSKIKP